jgi:hypothetical protein
VGDALITKGVLWLVAAMLALAPSAPTVAVDRTTVAPGDRVLVRLTGWPAGTATIEVCGAAAAGSAGCAIDASVQTYVSAKGVGGAPLTVVAPPGGCPCVVRVTALAGGATATTPLTVTGAPVTVTGGVPAPAPVTGDASAVPAPARVTGGAPVVTGVAVEREGSWPAWFGGPARRTLVLRVRNDAPAPAAVALSITAGRGTAPTGFVVPPDVPDLAPGGEREIRVPVSLPAPAVGTYTIAGEVTSAGHTARFAATTDHHPWGIPALLAALLAALSLPLLRPPLSRLRPPLSWLRPPLSWLRPLGARRP